MDIINFKINNFLLVITLIAISLILLLNINTFYWADDYNFMLDLNKYGVFENCLRLYKVWDGRFLSVGAFVQGFLISHFRVEIITFFWNLLFLISGFFTFHVIIVELNLEIDRNTKFLLSFITSVFFWLGSYIHINQTIYWATGGIYSFDLLIGVLWILSYLKIDLKSNLKLFLFLLFSFIAGATTQNLTIGLITLVFINIIINLLERKKSDIKFNIITLLFLILGLSVLMFSPGNALRIAEFPEFNINNITLLGLLKNYLFVFENYYLRSKWLILLTFICGIGFRIFIKLDFFSFLYIDFKTLSLVAFLKNIKWLLVALSTLTPFIFITSLAVDRTLIYFMTFIVIFILITLLKSNPKKIYKTYKIYKLISFGLILTVLGYSLIFSFINLKKGIVLKYEITKREQILLNSKNKTVTVNQIPSYLISDCYTFFDFPVDAPKGNFIIEGPKKYYNLNKLIVKWASEGDRLEGKVVMSKTGDWFVIKDGKRWMAMSEPATTDYLNSMRNGQNNVIRDVDPKTLEQFPIIGEILPRVNFVEK